MSGQDAVDVRVRLLPHAAGLPERASAGSAGYDLRAATSGPVRIEPGTRRLIPTGLVLGLPPGHEAQIRPRSGLAYRQGLTVLNAPGTIDSDYRGEVKLLLVNLGDEPVTVQRGERLAQMVVAAVPEIAFREDDALGRRPTAGRPQRRRLRLHRRLTGRAGLPLGARVFRPAAAGGGQKDAPAFGRRPCRPACAAPRRRPRAGRRTRAPSGR